MIEKRHIHQGKAAIVAAFLILTYILPLASSACPSGEPAAAARQASNRKTNMKTQKKSSGMPDFAFPETVEKNAVPRLKEAMRNKDGIGAVKAAIEVIVARNSISSSSFNENVAMLDSMASELAAPYSSLCLLLEADMYRQLYNDDRWTYRERTLPLDSYPSDPLAWSSELFARKTLELVRKANGNTEAAESMPVKDIATVLTDVENAEKSGLTIYDFIVYKSHDLLDTFRDGSSEMVIPFRKDGGVKAVTPAEQCWEYGRDLMKRLFEYHEAKGDVGPLAVAVCRYSDTFDNEDRPEFLKEWISRLDGTPDVALVMDDYFNSLDIFANSDRNANGVREIYGTMKGWLAKFPDSRFSKMIKNDVAIIENRSVVFQVPNIALPGEPVKINASLRNLNKVYALIYSVPEKYAPMNGLNRKAFPSKAKFVKAVPVEAEGTVPFSSEKEIELPALPTGYYVIVPSSKPVLSAGWKKEVREWSLTPINITDISVINSSNSGQKGSSRVYVVDARTQKPIEGARVEIYSDRNPSRIVRSGLTDASGAFDAPEGFNQMKVRYGKSLFCRWVDFQVYENVEKASAEANILTDLSIYKPGDKVSFSLVGWTAMRHDSKLLKNAEVDVVMRDANGNPVDTLSLKTDEWGRCNGSFMIPKTGLLGNYSLSARFTNYPERDTRRTYFEVAEYKAPGFLVTVDADDELVYEAGDTIYFRGSVRTYSGMPLGGSAVSFHITWQPWWRWWNRGGNASYGGDVTADADGNFEIELPTRNLKGTRFEKGIYTLSVSATSASGETQSSQDVRFCLGEGLTVRPMIPIQIPVEADSLKFNVPVYDMLDHPVRKKVDYIVKEDASGREVLKGMFESPSLIVPSASLPSGRYRFTFNVAGDTVTADAVVAIYHKDDKRPPFKTPLWVPEKKIICKEGERKVSVPVGSGYAGSWILCVVSDEKGIIDRRWIEADDCNTVMTVDAPSTDSRYWVSFSGMHDFEQKTAEVVIIPEAQERKLEVSASSFRDRISAGDKESWKFAFKMDSGNVGNIPAMAVMSNQALNAIAPFKWEFFVGKGWWNRSHLSSIDISKSAVEANMGPKTGFVRMPSFSLDWNTYGYSLAGNRQSFRKLMIRGTKGIVEEDGVAYVAADQVRNESLETVYVTSAQMKNSFAGSARSEAKKENDDVAYDEDEAPESSAEAARGAEEVRPRPVEMPLAFFMPDLVSDGDGVVSVNFETPDFNTTWQFQIMGYTEDLLTAGLVKDAVASKPVMVQSNLPRFLRTGDKASVSALLFNNSDKSLPIGGEIIVADPATGKTIASVRKPGIATEPAGKQEMSLVFDVPSDVSAVMVTAYAYGENFSDGERDIVAVLPSSTPVVESTQFYLGKGEKTFSVKLPKFRKDANVTLKYCNNPVWECILALPSISKPESKNILSLMKALFANSFALDVASKNPAVREGLEKALAAKAAGDTTVLRSNLEKDASLKTVALQNTPWVNNAASETERMENLSTLLDVKTGKATVESIFRDVKSLQNADGGWSWCPGMESSLFMTGRALLHLGMMKRIGCLPSEGEPMAKKAIAYSDRELYEDYVKSDYKISVQAMLGYLYIRSFFDAGNWPKGFSAMKEKAMKAIADEWKSFSIYDKATAATLFSRTKGYEREARIVLESLRQLASKDDAKGWWYDNLDSGWNGWSKLITTAQVLEAYADVEPEAQAVDGIRQWLVLQKETEDWGDNPYTVEVIQAILSCGTDWTSDSAMPEIRLGDSRIEIPESEMLTGAFTISLDSKSASGKRLTIGKESASPAWGGVISQYVAPIKDVKSAACENLSIEKKILLISETEGGQVASEGKLKTGDKVRVTLTVTCDKDMNYVALVDERAACLEPDGQISEYTSVDGIWAYREVRNNRTSFFINFLPKGVNVISYDCYVDRAGVYSTGIASVQSQYSPLQSAHSAGSVITVSGK